MESDRSDHPDVPMAPVAVPRHLASDRRVDLRRVETPMLTAQTLDYDGDRSFEGVWHSNDFHYFDMTYVPRTDGSQAGFEDFGTRRRTPGKVMFAPAGQRLSGVEGAGRQFSLNVFLRASSEVDGGLELDQNMEAVAGNCLDMQNASVTNVLIAIGSEVREPGFAGSLLLEGMAMSLLSQTARHLRDLRQRETRKGGLSPWRMQLIDDRLRGDSRLPGLEELAELCGLSRRQLMRAFREETGQTLGAYAHNLMLERATFLLRETKQPISCVASALGYTHAGAFSVAFRKASGKSPRAFRASFRSGAR